MFVQWRCVRLYHSISFTIVIDVVVQLMIMHIPFFIRADQHELVWVCVGAVSKFQYMFLRTYEHVQNNFFSFFIFFLSFFLYLALLIFFYFFVRSHLSIILNYSVCCCVRIQNKNNGQELSEAVQNNWAVTTNGSLNASAHGKYLSSLVLILSHSIFSLLLFYYRRLFAGRRSLVLTTLDFNKHI